MGLPLEGVRVLDLSRLVNGPFCTMLLGDQGAEIIKIEVPGEGDGLRRVGAPSEFLNGESVHWLAFNRNKKGVTLDMKRPDHREAFYDLVRISDVVFDNFRPKALKSMGIEYETLKRYNPQIISCSNSGFGGNSVYAHLAAFDPVVQAMGGVMSLTRDREGRPVRTGVAIGDLIPPIYAAWGITLALYHRKETGKGSRVDISQLDSMISLLGYYATRYLNTGYVPQLIGGHMSVAPWGIFKTKDEYLVLGVSNQLMWEVFCQVIGLPDLPKDERFLTMDLRKANEPALNAILEAQLQTRESLEWVALLQDLGVVCSAIYSVPHILDDQHTKDRGMVVTIDHPAAGKFRAANNPVHNSLFTQPRVEPPPALGEHNKEVFGGLLGYSNAKLNALFANGHRPAAPAKRGAGPL
ncbi:MAG: CoA transferase [Chloroflexi bacterium]|nr:CoA transferase [Chloroflexota bacterium]